MKHITIFTYIIFLCILCTSCTEDLSDFEDKECLVGLPVMATLDFGEDSFEDITITTRATTDGGFEHIVRNFYLLIFKKDDGTKVCGKFFDVNNKKMSIDEVQKSYSEQCWAVQAPTQSSEVQEENGYKKLGDPSHGRVRVKTPSGGPYDIYIFANIDDTYLNLSPEMFDGFTNEADLSTSYIELLHNPMSRSKMLMIGSVKGVQIDVNGKVTKDNNPLEYKDKNNNNALKLQRMDAKVEVRIHIDPTRSTSSSQSNTVKDFIPESWEVVNLTNRTKLIETAQNADIPDEEKSNKEYYYNSGRKNFEHSRKVTVNGKEVDEHIFSFYMLENKQTCQNEITDADYHKRDLRTKKSDGTYSESGPMWVNAPERGTYLKITGQVALTYSKPNSITGEDQAMYTDVSYYIHLGDFSTNVNNYDVVRNTRYTYTISIVDVNNIIAEVKTSQETQSGAAGDVYVAKQDICIFDAHYGQEVMNFYADDIDDRLTWYVETPFNKEGAGPDDGVKIDNKWVKFARNLLKSKDGQTIISPEREQNNPEDQRYSHFNRWYLGDDKLKFTDYTPTVERLMDVDAFVNYLKEEKHKLQNGLPNDFRLEKVKDKSFYVIYVTAFVDEFYYDEVPTAGSGAKNLWTMFVNNCGSRMMHILCDKQQSLDKESSFTSSVFTIRQTPIQTVYNPDMKYAVDKAWGCESIDENGVSSEEGKNLNYGKYSSGNQRFDIKGKETKSLLTKNTINQDGKNGLYNTWSMCGFDNGASKSWNAYLNIHNSDQSTLYWELPESYNKKKTSYFETNGETPLRGNIHFIKDRHWMYSFLIRNRDNNGDGIIDKNEIRWYIASLDQLQALFIGTDGISGESKIYPDSLASQTGDNWRLHLISSTIEKDKDPEKLWAEEGVSVSLTSEVWGKKGGIGIRCVRNLGIPNWNNESTAQLYDDLITVKEDFEHNRVFFDASRMNRKALRSKGSVDPRLATLMPTDEYGSYSMLPLGFAVYCNNQHKAEKYIWGGHDGSDKYDELKKVLDNGIQLSYPERNPKNSPALPNGTWRMPNLRELAVMYIYKNTLLPSGINNSTYVFSTTFYSFGEFGLKKKGVENNKCWFFKENHVCQDTNINNEPVKYILVQDWYPTEHL